MERGHAVVKIYTDHHAIVGKILLVEREFHRGRLSDYINRSDLEFVPVQDAHVFSLATRKAIHTKTFLLLNKRAINWLIPVREPGTSSEELTPEEALGPPEMG